MFFCYFLHLAFGCIIVRGEITMHEQFAFMYDTLFDDVYRYVLFKVGNKWVAEDLVGDIFRKAFQRFDVVGDVELDQQKAWLITISRNTVIDYYRKKKEAPYGHDPEVFGYGEIVLDVPNSNDTKQECLEQSLSKLNPQEKEIINLKYIVGLKYSEISEMTHKQEDWLKMKSHRIKKKMLIFIYRCMGGAHHA